ncbi:MAG: adenylosuccinate synthase [Nitrospirota bacterium]
MDEIQRGRCLVVVGGQWGDEGKGKIVDILSAQADVVARYQGGHNAGHTVILDGDPFILHLIPSGILRPETRCVIGSGVVVDPVALLEEMDSLAARGIDINGRLVVSARAHLILPHHRAIDKESERLKGVRKIGTTGRGIGPAYVDKMARVGLRVGDLLNPRRFRQRLAANVQEMNVLLREVYKSEGIDAEEAAREYLGYGERLAPFIGDTFQVLNDAIDAGKTVLFEGAQGTLLDVDHGTYPFVTSSSAAAGGACTGTGVGPTRISAVLGVVKAYTTRVGSGPFPTEISGEEGDAFRERGKEYGATTGRPRRCGWFDAVAVRYAVRLNALSCLAVTKLDVLDVCRTIKVCVGYRHEGRTHDAFPSDLEVIESCVPVYEEMSGWMTSTSGIQHWDDLPREAKSYLKRLSDLVGAGIAMVSTGARRDETIRVPGALEW